MTKGHMIGTPGLGARSEYCGWEEVGWYLYPGAQGVQ